MAESPRIGGLQSLSPYMYLIKVLHVFLMLNEDFLKNWIWWGHPTLEVYNQSNTYIKNTTKNLRTAWTKMTLPSPAPQPPQSQTWDHSQSKRFLESEERGSPCISGNAIPEGWGCQREGMFPLSSKMTNLSDGIWRRLTLPELLYCKFFVSVVT